MGAADKLPRFLKIQVGVAVVAIAVAVAAVLQLGSIQQEVAELERRKAVLGQSLDEGGKAWSFVGTSRDGSYVEKNFDVTEVPSVGSEIVATRDTYRRSGRPEFTQASGFTVGRIDGPRGVASFPTD